MPTTAPHKAHILIAGGGIGGMSAALGLVRAGFKVSLFEQTAVMGEVGAGITIQPSATRALDFLGLGDELRREADLSGSPIIFHYKTGEVITRFMDDSQIIDANGVSWFHRIHRADFQRMLERALRAASPDTLRLGARVVSVSQDAKGATIELKDGTKVTGDIVIGADGVRSAVRGKLFKETPPQFRNQVAYRALVPMDKVADIFARYPAGTYIGPGAIVNRYPVRHATILNCVGIVKTDDWTDEGWSTPTTREEFLAKFVGWHDSLTGLIKAAPDSGMIKWALYDREPLPHWTIDRVTLLGDAAHPTLPFLGLAGATAIEDAVILARACAGSPHDLPAALARYENARMPRTHEIWLKSRQQGDIFQEPNPETFVTKPRPHADNQLFAYDPATVGI